MKSKPNDDDPTNRITTVDEGLPEDLENSSSLLFEGDRPDATVSIEIAPAPDAAVCGALGCHVRDELVEVDVPGERTRVLCQRHKRDFIGVST